MLFLPKNIVGIDLHDHTAQLVELKQTNKKICLEAYSRFIVPSKVIQNGEIKNEEAFKNAITYFLEKANPSPITTKAVALILPARKTFTHIFEFPSSLTEEEIKKTISYEAETIIPFSIQDVYWDFFVLHKESEENKHASQYILFGAIPKPIADHYARLLESIGLNPVVFTIHAESLKYALQQQIDPQKATLIIELGALATNYLIMKDRVIHYFFSSNEGGGKIIEALAKEHETDERTIIEKWEQNKLNTKDFLPTIEKFIQTDYKLAQALLQDDAGERKTGPIQEIVLTGEFLNLPRVYEFAKTTFPNQTVTIGDPKNGLVIESEKFLPLHHERGGPIPYSTYFTSAIGVALRAFYEKRGRNGLNLLPDRLKTIFSNKKTSFLIALSSIFMCGLSLFAATFLFLKHQNLSFERLNLEIKKSAVENMIYGTRYKEIQEAIIAFNTEVTLLKNIDNGLFSAPLVFTQLFDLSPQGITLTTFYFIDSDLSVEISGIADQREDLLEFQQNLQKSPFIKEVIAPISNYDEKFHISFIMKLALNFSELPPYASSPNP